MKITCQSCHSKYTIADDKVVGKVVKIRCKKCGATIVVNGNDPAASASSGSVHPEVPGADEAWTVNVADGDQRTMTDAEVVDAYHAGIVTDETFCWKDGMSDWLPVREIEVLAEACRTTHALAAPPGTGGFPRGAAASAGIASAAGQPQRDVGFGGGNGAAGALAAASGAAAARRAGGRAPAGDLFGGVAQAGGEEDVMTSAPAGMPQMHAPEGHDDPQKMTGERNENSVLFSLSALTSKGTGPTKPTAPGVEQSGLIDIRQLSAQLHSVDDKKKSRIDDIMNLAGGGAFSPSLTGPILAAPAVSEYTAPDAGAMPAAAHGKGRGLVLLALAAGAIVIVGAIGGAVVLIRGKGPEAAENEKAAASASAAALAAASASAAAPPSSAADTASAAVASAAPSDTPAPVAKVASNTPKAAAAGAAAKDTPAPAAAPPKDNSLAAAMAGAAGTPPAAAPAAQAGSDQPFNMGEAKARLGAAASAAQGCKKPDGPTGSGRVVVLFAPSGATQSATVSGPPFEGTPTGNCVAGRFRAVRVPAFSGSPFSVSKSFSIN